MTITLTREEAQQVLDALMDTVEEMRSLNGQADGQEAAIAALCARLAQPEPKDDGRCQACEGNHCTAKKGCVALSNPQEPVAWWHDMGDVVDLNVSGRGTPLYTAPPQRNWQGLTDEEITALKRNGERYISSQDFARAIEAKLKEKNT